MHRALARAPPRPTRATTAIPAKPRQASTASPLPITLPAAMPPEVMTPIPASVTSMAPTVARAIGSRNSAQEIAAATSGEAARPAARRR